MESFMFLILVSTCWILVYKNTIDACVYLVSVTLLKWLINSKNLGCFIYHVIFHTDILLIYQKDTFIYLFHLGAFYFHSMTHSII